eukprot:9283183-Ditylum_brightwellii.AAC.1
MQSSPPKTSTLYASINADQAHINANSKPNQKRPLSLPMPSNNYYASLEAKQKSVTTPAFNMDQLK